MLEKVAAEEAVESMAEEAAVACWMIRWEDIAVGGWREEIAVDMGYMAYMVRWVQCYSDNDAGIVDNNLGRTGSCSCCDTWDLHVAGGDTGCTEAEVVVDYQ